MQLLKQVNRIILHCSDTEDGPGLSWPAIRHYHIKGNGWQDVGYHYGLEWVGRKLLLLPGRPVRYKGAHCSAAAANHDSLGLCVVGDFDEAPPSPEVLDATVQALAMLCFAWHLPAGMIFGHRELDERKTCPGKLWNLDGLRRLVRDALYPDGLEQGPRLLLDD